MRTDSFADRVTLAICSMFRLMLSTPVEAVCMLREMSCVTAFCSSTAPAIVVEMLVDGVDRAADLLDRLGGAAGRVLHAGDLRGDLLGGLAGLVGQRLDLGRDDGKTPARLAGARRLDGGVERQQVGLRRRPC